MLHPAAVRVLHTSLSRTRWTSDAQWKWTRKRVTREAKFDQFLPRKERESYISMGLFDSYCRTESGPHDVDWPAWCQKQSNELSDALLLFQKVAYAYLP